LNTKKALAFVPGLFVYRAKPLKASVLVNRPIADLVFSCTILSNLKI